MPEQDRTIIVHDNEGKEIYRGPDKRYYSSDYKSAIFGIPIPDLLKIVVYIGGIIVFLVKADLRLNALEELEKGLMEQNKVFQEYVVSADSFQSSIYGIQFKNGRPLNDGYTYRNKKLGGTNE